MASQKPQRTPAEIEDIILRKIFLVSLADPEFNDPRVGYLELTAAELLSEGKPLLLARDLLERVLIDRLSGNFPGAEPAFDYLLGCYRRAQDEAKKVGSIRDSSVRLQMESAAKQAGKLSVSYCKILLGNPDMFSQNGDSFKGVSQLLDLVFSEVATSFGGDSLGGGRSSPPGFLDEFFRYSDLDSLEPIMRDLYDKLKESVLRVSILGNFQQPLRALLMLVNYPNCAKLLVKHPSWLPKGQFVPGRVIEMMSILGPFFHVSALSDHMIFKSEPDVRSALAMHECQCLCSFFVNYGHPLIMRTKQV